MTADPLNPSGEHDPERPDWLLGTGDVDNTLTPPVGLPNVALRRPGSGESPPPRAPRVLPTPKPHPVAAAPAEFPHPVAAPSDRHPTPASAPPATAGGTEEGGSSDSQRLRVPGLVGHDVPIPLPSPIVAPRAEQFGLATPAAEQVAASPVALAVAATPAAATPVAATPADADAKPAPWTAAASSIPSLKRRRADVPEPVLEAASEVWDEGPAEIARNAAASTEKQARSTPANAMASIWPRIEAMLGFLARVPRLVWIGAAAVVVIVTVVIVLTRPREHFERVRTIRQQAMAFDGRTVHVRGVVGQVFAVGEGFAFFLHQNRDTIVVYSRGLAPSERSHIRLAGTVSTGYLDGVPRAAIFESEREK